MSFEHIKSLQKGLSAKQRLYQIVEHGMCIGCGICESVAGADRLKMELVSNGFERPCVTSDLNHEIVDSIVSVCPGTHVEGLPTSLIDDDSQLDDVWGVFKEIYFSYSGEPAIRHVASTGGVLTGLALYLVESNSVDFILHATASAQHPSFGQPQISRTREDVLRAAGSRYGPTATLKHILSVLEAATNSGERFAFIGTPCDVSALRNLAAVDSRVDQTCLVMLTMVCGGFMAPLALKRFFESRDIVFDEITSVRYRGYGCPGPTTVKTADGNSHEISYLDFWGEDDSAWQLPTRCKICPDGIGDAADIAASDVWDGGAPTQQEIDSDLGSNGVIVRTEAGSKLMNEAIAAGYLVRGEQLSTEDMNRFQPHQEAKKRSVWARFQGMHEAGNLVPETQRLRLISLSEQNSDIENTVQRTGAKRRVARGKMAEPAPCKLQQAD